jgi:hypothetical protein
LAQKRIIFSYSFQWKSDSLSGFGIVQCGETQVSFTLGKNKAVTALPQEQEHAKIECHEPGNPADECGLGRRGAAIAGEAVSSCSGPAGNAQPYSQAFLFAPAETCGAEEGGC